MAQYNQQVKDSRTNDKLWSQVSSVKEEVAGLETKMELMEKSQNQAFAAIREDIRLLATKQDRPTNWIGVAMMILGMLTVAGTYVQTRLSPTESIVSELQRVMPLAYVRQGEFEKGLEWHASWLETFGTLGIKHSSDIGDSRERLAALEAGFLSLKEEARNHFATDGHPGITREIGELGSHLESLAGHVSAIDEGGSRGWLSVLRGDGISPKSAAQSSNIDTGN